MIINNFITWLFRSALKSKRLQKSTTSIITELYRDIAMGSLHLKTEIIKVKKGKAKYRLVFLSTEKLNYRLNIGRHKEPFSAEISLPNR